ncbi:hypothetical protein ACFIJ5_17925 (plasmid) [Haloimpatiens sp. FM7330]|uniref:hypothetical protein n=1 Tax=Haloimpatiens sp. FM7330 TaxID=3298610 RepID=UPI00363EC7F9
MKDLLKIKGQVNLILKDKEGNIKKEVKNHNLIVSKGKDGIAEQLLDSPTIAKPAYMQIGTNDTKPILNDTSLKAAVGPRVRIGKQRKLNVVTYKGVFGPGQGTGTIKEAGIFNAQTGGVLYARTVFGVITKGSEDTLEVTWSWTIGA